MPASPDAGSIVPPSPLTQPLRSRNVTAGSGTVGTGLEDSVGTFEAKAIGRVESPLADPGAAPRQADEGAPEAWLALEPEMLEGLRGLKPGDRIVLLTWLDRARRDLLSVHPRGDAARPPEGVFSTRAPHRPNPIGLHEVTIAAIEGTRIRVHHLEALDGTPILDLKPVLDADISRR